MRACTQPRYGSKSNVGSVSASVVARFDGSFSTSAFSSASKNGTELSRLAARLPEWRRRLRTLRSLSSRSAAACISAASRAIAAASSKRRATCSVCVGASRPGRGANAGRSHQTGSSAAAASDTRSGARCTAGWSARVARQLWNSSHSIESEGTEASSDGCEHAAWQWGGGRVVPG